MEDSEECEYEEMPGFGCSSTNDDEVMEFYQKWGSFTTCKSFYMFDVYDEREAEDRWGRRQIQRLNKRERQKQRRDYIQTIRSLVDVVKKRDERVRVIMEKEEQKKEERRKQKEQEDQLLQQRQKEARRLAREEEQRRFQQED